MQQIFDIPKRERETDVQHHCKANDLRAGFEILERGRIGHVQKLRNTPARLKQSSSDKTIADWGEMRIVFLQYSSDPIVFYDPSSLWRAPPWMNEPPAEDVSKHLVFIPVVTQFQLALDMALSFGTPPGHGHAYFAQDYISPWVEVTAPADWNATDTKRLKAHCDIGYQLGCQNR
ncbi:alpha/beta-hydrolase family protein [Ruegeria atlantica]|uniref:alpha/beta-hydrolase family protein n=1 Tax=Ruegeria atlantica TaxID=81569 RepID=UPI002494E0CF|nr:alpha/beta-hydrolase family protein [Ruegeria atlantica]